jgi:hypothetical protein
MADNTLIPTESVPMQVIPQATPQPGTNTNPQPQPTPPTQPVTTQTVEPPKPTLDVKQAAETFDALNKLFDNVEAPKPVLPVINQIDQPGQEVPRQAEPPKGQEPPAGTPVGTDIDKKLEEIKAEPGAHPNVAKGIETLKEMVKTEAQKAEELKAKVTDYEKKVQTYEQQIKEGKLPEPVEKELKELREFRREVDFRSSPEFKQSFIDPVAKADSTIMSLLKQAGAKEDTLKFLAENGGIIALSESNEKAGVKDKPDMTMAEWVENYLLARTPTVFRNRILANLTAAQDTIEKGRAELEDWKANSQQRYEARVNAIKELFNAGADEARAAIGEIAKPKTIPADATAEQRQQIEAHNRLVAEGEQKFGELLKTHQDPKQAGAILVKAAQADMLLKMHESDQATIRSLNDRIARMTASGAHSQAGNNTPPPGAEKPSMGDLLKQPTETAMEGHFRNLSVTP